MNEKIDGRPIQYSVFVVYSERVNKYLGQKKYDSDTFTGDATKARVYTRKGDASRRLSHRNITGNGFAVYERKISAADYKCQSSEDKNEIIRQLRLEVDRLSSEITKLQIRRVNDTITDRFGPPYK